MADVTDIGEERERRETQKILEAAKKGGDVGVKLNMFGVPVNFGGYVFSGDERSGDRLSIGVYDVRQDHLGIIGFLILDRTQWNALKEAGDKLLTSHNEHIIRSRQ